MSSGKQKMNNICYYAVSRKGVDLSLKLQGNYGGDVYTIKKFAKNQTNIIDTKLKIQVKLNWNKYDTHIFVMASGIVVRSIKDMIKGKDVDPAVLVIDDSSDFVIPLLSGHLGGANKVAEGIATYLKSIPVVTTASDRNNSIAIDTLAEELDAKMESLEEAKSLTSLIIDNKEVSIKLPKNLGLDHNNPEGVVVVSNRDRVEVTRLYPQNLIVGLGCKRGTARNKLIEFLVEVFDKYNYALESIREFTSVSIKADEVAMLGIAKEFNRNISFIPIEEIKEVEDLFEGSKFVKKTLGVASVSAPCAYIVGNKNGRMIVEKEKKDGMTISIFCTED